MTYLSSQVTAQIWRHGREAVVLEKEADSTNAFGNTDHSYTPVRTVIAFQTYPNRNTSLESSSGDRHQNNPVFLVPVGPDNPAPPAPEDRLDYKNETYEIDSHTTYDTHVEFFGQPVIH